MASSPIAVGSQLRAYSMICRELEVPPDPAVIGTLKTNSTYLKVGKSQPHHAEGRYLALVELLLYQFEGSSHDDAATREVLQNFKKRRARSASVTGVSDVRMTPITHLDLSGYGSAAGANGGGLLRILLTVDSYLTVLEIHNSDLDAHSAETMSEGLLRNTTLKKLILEGNPLGMEGTVAIANNLPDNTNLTLLDVTNTQASFKGVQQLEYRVKEINAIRSQSAAPLKLIAERNFCLEELANSISHGIASVGAIFGAGLLLPKASRKGEREFLSCVVFITAMLTCYISSTLYHSMFMLKRTQKVFQVLDHSAIYLLIAGTYTPVVLIQLYDVPNVSWLLIFQWVIAFIGITMRALAPEDSSFVNRLQLISFVAMGWSALTVIPHILSLAPFYRDNIIIGGVFYTVGIFFFIRGEVWPMYHAVWHLFTIAGGLCHFLVVYGSVS